MVYLAGDIGGTKTQLALYKDEEEGFVPLRKERFPSRDYEDLETIVKEFLKDSDEKIGKACFGIAGPVKKGVSHATNLPWIIDRKGTWYSYKEKRLGQGKEATRIEIKSDPKLTDELEKLIMKKVQSETKEKKEEKELQTV